MKTLDIEEGILRKASKCEKGHACLSGDDRCLEEVEHSVQDSVCYVNCKEDDCPYWVSHGFLGVVCSCPVRVAIFRRHGK